MPCKSCQSAVEKASIVRDALTSVCERSYVDAEMKTRTSFYIGEDLQRGLEALKERDGMPAAEAIRRAIAAFLEEKDIKVASRAKSPRRAAKR
jgi:predicted DNA-binding protein